MPDFVGNRGAKLWRQTKAFYERRENKPVWIVRGEPQATVRTLTTILSAAQDEGLNPQEYPVKKIQDKVQLLKQQGSAAAAMDLELYLTYTLLRYSAHVALGHPIAQEIDKDWSVAPRKLDIPGVILKALVEQELEDLPNRLAPPHPEYARLKNMLKRYRKIAAEGKLQSIPQNLDLEAGKSNPHLAALRNNLRILGDLQETSWTDKNVFNEDLSTAKADLNGRHAVQSEKAPDAKKIAAMDRYDKNLTEAIRRFETRHGLEADGVPDAVMIAAMNVPLENRVRQLEINLERWRWLPADLGSPHIFVNIPAFRMQVRDSNEKISVKMRVIVGTKTDRTPVFSDTMTEVVFSPYWNIPASIETREILPLIMQDPGYLEHKNIEVVRIVDGQVETVDPSSIDWEDPEYEPDFQLRQKPGGENALGLVKFIFPNRHNIYLHDTPTGNLFDKLTRSFSHGCVRLEKPIELAAYVLRDQPEWTAERIDAAMHANEENHVSLKSPIAVHLVYFTARVDEDGVPQFFEDIYEYDLKQKHLLRQH